MPVGLLGRKVGNTQVYNEAGEIVPVTVIEAGPCVVLQIRTQDKDGYEAVQIGFDDAPLKKKGDQVVLASTDYNAKRLSFFQFLPALLLSARSFPCPLISSPPLSS